MRASILIASYGSERWRRIGDTRAWPSTEHQGAHEVIRVHEAEGTNASSRNAAAEMATGDWLIFLDADDELAPGYVGAMRSTEWDLSSYAPPRPCLLAPATSYRRGNRVGAPMFNGECDLREANWLVIGTAVPRNLFLSVGGFVEDEPHGLEDWSLWQRCVKVGAVPVKVPDAVYIAHQSRVSKHQALARDRRRYLTEYHKVRRRNHPELYPDGWTIEDALRPVRNPRVSARRR